MSDLLNRIKSSPMPRQISALEYYAAARKKQKIANILYTLFWMAASALWIITVINIHQYNRSFDNCLDLLEQIEANTVILDQQINSLSQTISGVDYE